MKYRIVAIIIVSLCICHIDANEKRALLIGISDYPSHRCEDLSWSKIHGTNDVALINDVLRKQGFTSTILSDADATAEKIRTALKVLSQKCRQGDIVYIHFSGHGQPFEDLSGDEPDGWDESIVPYNAFCRYKVGDYEGGNHILDDELEQFITVIRKNVGTSGYVYMVLDACHSGGASRGEEMEDDELFVRGLYKGFSPNGKKYIPKIDRRGNMKIPALSVEIGGVCILEACRAYQTNVEIKQNGRYYGALTYYVCQVLQNVVLTSDTEWVETVRALMEKDQRLIKQNMVSEKSN